MVMRLSMFLNIISPALSPNASQIDFSGGLRLDDGTSFRDSYTPQRALTITATQGEWTPEEGTTHNTLKINYDNAAHRANAILQQEAVAGRQKDFWQDVGGFFKSLKAPERNYADSTEVHVTGQGYSSADNFTEYYKDKYYGFDDDMFAALKTEQTERLVKGIIAQKEIEELQQQEQQGTSTSMYTTGHYTGEIKTGAIPLYQRGFEQYPSTFNNNLFQSDFLAGYHLRNSPGRNEGDLQGYDPSAGQQNPLWEIVGRQPSTINDMNDFVNRTYGEWVREDENGDKIIDWEGIAAGGGDPYLINTWEELGYIEQPVRWIRWWRLSII